MLGCAPARDLPSMPGREPSVTWRFDMKIRDVMTRTAELTTPDDTLRHAAQMMKECDCGVLPVAEGDRLVGMLTDRDIAVRGIAAGKGPDAKVREAMTEEVLYCFDDEDLSHVCQNMAEIQVRRLPVMNRDKRLVGIVSLSDLAKKEANTAKALRGIARPSEQHNQAA
jgi:CBS domain-containing protein